ncbi:uncharacterized protein EV422DRAFT_135304 [Fimicolochytrium jonesii]|uniref:uncharacterized protein n=1 Tax=Fimicolochytrium jonesii TaxID=1396493 RepID=UPI0022FEB1E1|nr:uncharacterized protein EV422DRAFT_135304 [Fimicolochytrium jonesii]KAI8825650.1 hypothetical protein EV422DRAFT_135304 [Fimicolochytrium jonesii]
MLDMRVIPMQCTCLSFKCQRMNEQHNPSIRTRAFPALQNLSVRCKKHTKCWLNSGLPSLHGSAKPGPLCNSRSTPTLAAWGAFGGIAALYFLEPTPLARTDIFQNIPVVGEYWKEKLEAAQKKD